MRWFNFCQLYISNAFLHPAIIAANIMQFVINIDKISITKEATEKILIMWIYELHKDSMDCLITISF